ncbi:unnamed protein product, partial [Urochloa humidicola]
LLGRGDGRLLRRLGGCGSGRRVERLLRNGGRDGESRLNIGRRYRARDGRELVGGEGRVEAGAREEVGVGARLARLPGVEWDGELLGPREPQAAAELVDLPLRAAADADDEGEPEEEDCLRLHGNIWIHTRSAAHA